MTVVRDSMQANLLTSSFWGVARGIIVHSIIYPLDVIKIRQQCQQSPMKSHQVAQTVFQKEGLRAFYQGLPPQLLKTSLKQMWAWPMITGLPPYLSCYQIGDLTEQALTGCAISTVDAGITTPLERAKVHAAARGKTDFSIRNIYKDGWRGFTAHWTKLSVHWSTFLVAQKHLRDRKRKQSEKPLTFSQLAVIGTQVAGIVSVVAAPFDIASNLKQAKGLSPMQLVSTVSLRTFYRGWPLSALSLTIHNIASVFVLDRLGQKPT